MTRQEIKAKSRHDLGGKIFGNVWLSAVVISLVYGLITGVASVGGNFNTDTSANPNGAVEIPPVLAAIALVLSIVSLVISLVIMPIHYGHAKAYLNITRGEKATLNDLFCGFKENVKQNFLTAFMISLYTFLWSLLFIIPGIVKSYSYSMALYIKNDHPEYTWKEAITESRQMMDGRKMELFIQQLSFIGWMIVGVCCFGIGTFWVDAYYQTAMANFYNDKSGYNQKVILAAKKAAEEKAREEAEQARMQQEESLQADSSSDPFNKEQTITEE